MSEFNFIIIEGHQTLTSEMAFVLSDLDRQYFPTPWSLVSWQNLFFEHDRLLVVIKSDSLIIGLCLFDKSHADSFAHLLKILLDPQYRNFGLSKELLKVSMRILEKAGYTQFFLEVEENNMSAKRLYLATGFKVIHFKKDFYGANRNAYIMTAIHKTQMDA